MLAPGRTRCRVIVDLRAIRDNYVRLRELVGSGTALLCVIKADAYGHGAKPVARALWSAGARHFGVASLEEACELRDGAIGGSVVVLCGIEQGAEREAALRGIEPLIGSIGQLRRWNETAGRLRRKLSCHLLLNTGMNRLGIDFDPAASDRLRTLLGALAECDWVSANGVATHYASAENFASGQTESQGELFGRQLNALRAAGIAPRYVHSANSAAILYRREALGNRGETMARPGLALYGCAIAAVGGPVGERPGLRPALEWRATLQGVRDVRAGARLGYGASFVAEHRMRVGILSVGYADGLDWRLSNAGSVSLGGKRCPIVGQISMDLTLVDLQEAEFAEVGDEALLLGAEPYGAEGMAALTGGIPYEVLCRISKRVPRQYERRPIGR